MALFHPRVLLLVSGNLQIFVCMCCMLRVAGNERHWICPRFRFLFPSPVIRLCSFSIKTPRSKISLSLSLSARVWSPSSSFVRIVAFSFVPSRAVRGGRLRLRSGAGGPHSDTIRVNGFVLVPPPVVGNQSIAPRHPAVSDISRVIGDDVPLKLDSVFGQAGRLVGLLIGWLVGWWANDRLTVWT